MTPTERKLMYSIQHLQGLGRSGNLPKMVFHEVDFIAQKIVPGSNPNDYRDRVIALLDTYGRSVSLSTL